jgi:alpha-amylase
MAMRNVRLIFGSTNSQPVGTADDDIEHVYQHSYKPFLRTLYNAPSIPVTLHYSGQLLQWLEKHHSEYTDVLSEMVGRKQIELLGGGFYDPVLSLIPRADRLGQIENLTTYLRKRFGRRPRGTWITQHVWEPSLASTLRSSGMEYVFLDDFHFIAAGLTGDDLFRPCITEDQGKIVTVFPVCHELKQIARGGMPEDVIEYLRANATDDPGQVFVLIDDGERYSEPTRPATGTGRHNVWLEWFVKLLGEQEWIKVELPAQHLKERRPRARGYFQAASHEEMMYWALAPEREESFEMLRRRFAEGRNGYISGGYFRQFLTRYSESNMMYAKMQYTHVLVNQIRGDKYRKQAAREELWKGQCHSAYWHGNHCGIYSNRLRKEVYRSLIEAEKKTRERGIFIPSVITVDFDMDGLDEHLYQGHDINAYVHSEGGVLFELDYLPTCWNYLDTLSRRRESYHDAVVAKAGYDDLPRNSFLDRFLDPDLTIDEYARSAYTDRGNFTDLLYERGARKRDTHQIALSASGSVQSGDEQRDVEIRKKYRFKRNTVQVEYEMRATEGEPFSFSFSPEINFAFLSRDAQDLEITVRDPAGKETGIDTGQHEVRNAAELVMRDLLNKTQITLSASVPSDYWFVPVETTSNGDGGLTTIYEGTSVVPRFAGSIAPDDPFALTIPIRIERG